MHWNNVTGVTGSATFPPPLLRGRSLWRHYNIINSTPRVSAPFFFLNLTALQNSVTLSSGTHGFSVLRGSFCVLADEECCQLDSCSMASLSLPRSSLCVPPYFHQPHCAIEGSWCMSSELIAHDECVKQKERQKNLNGLLFFLNEEPCCRLMETWSRVQ